MKNDTKFTEISMLFNHFIGSQYNHNNNIYFMFYIGGFLSFLDLVTFDSMILCDT